MRHHVAVVVAVAILSAAVFGACDEASSDRSVRDGLLTLVAEPRQGGGAAALIAYSEGVPDGWEVGVPDPATTWISAGRAGVLAATRADGTVAISDPLSDGSEASWRDVEATGPTGDPISGPAWFATWDPEGGRYAALAGDLPGGGPIRLALTDPTTKGAVEQAVDELVGAAPPAWVGDDAVALVGADPDSTSIVIDTTTGTSASGPAGDRLLSTSADGAVIAVQRADQAAIEVRSTEGWLAGSSDRLARIEPPGGARDVISMALDAPGERLAVAWLDDGGRVAVEVYRAAQDWRRVDRMELTDATGAVVAWVR